MADTRSGRDKQAHDVDRRQREHDLAAELERMDEPEPPVEADDLAPLEAELESLDFPLEADDVVAAVGSQTIDAPDGRYAVADLLPETPVERFESPTAVRARVQRPAIARALKRAAEAIDTLPNAAFGTSQREAYERTFLAVQALEGDDGVAAITDWIVEEVRARETIPGSRGVRREAAKLCRAAGHEIRNDEWLGV